MKIISETLTDDELKKIASNIFGNLVKAVVDVDRGILAVDAELHSDLEALLIDNGSKQRSLWGINIYPEMQNDNYIEFDSLINMRPSQGNRSRSVEDEEIRKKIIAIIANRVKR